MSLIPQHRQPTLAQGQNLRQIHVITFALHTYTWAPCPHFPIFHVVWATEIWFHQQGPGSNLMSPDLAPSAAYGPDLSGVNNAALAAAQLKSFPSNATAQIPAEKEALAAKHSSAAGSSGHAPTPQARDAPHKFPYPGKGRYEYAGCQEARAPRCLKCLESDLMFWRSFAGRSNCTELHSGSQRRVPLGSRQRFVSRPRQPACERDQWRRRDTLAACVSTTSTMAVSRRVIIGRS